MVFLTLTIVIIRVTLAHFIYTYIIAFKLEIQKNIGWQ